MVRPHSSVVDDRLQPSGDESGTAPGDRSFRPDVQGLRAVAVLLVVLYHANVPDLTGGFVGVDVFFVISGFVITGLLLRERHSTGRTSLFSFYARRCRRILPAATLAVVVTVIAAYVLLGVVAGSSTADDGRWAAAFLANVHFERVGTNYLLSQRLPSPLQNYWSLSVEEQFYLVYPTIFLVVARLRGGLSLRACLATTLSVIIVLSYWLSVVQTASHPAAAYFSPFTRAWELALGALVAVGTGWLKEIPSPVAALLTWAGLVAIIASAVAFNTQTAYPGSLVAVPVVGAALIIAGGTAMPRWGAEAVLGLPPCGWMGKLSYSLYLWHWPILIIAAEYSGKSTLSLGANLLLLVLALAVSIVSYRVVENPIRHWRLPSRRSVGIGLALALGTVGALSLVIGVDTATATTGGVIPAADARVVAAQVAAAPQITTVSKSIAKAEYGAAYVTGESFLHPRCVADFEQTRVPICTLGDPSGTGLMVVYGDSHALMWTPAFDAFARSKHWRLVVFGKLGCPAALVTVLQPAGVGLPSGPDTQCNQWHAWATRWINRHRPNLLVVSQADYYRLPLANVTPTKSFSASQWQSAMEGLFRSLTVPTRTTVLLGSTPILAQAGPVCLAAHPDDVQACSSPARDAVPRLDQADRQAALRSHVGYVDTTPWFCTTTCTPIIGPYEVYDSTGTHISGVWAKYLQNVLAEAVTHAQETRG